MKLFYRRVVYVIFVIIFLVGAPLVILYTQGYRYNFQRNRVQKTGILIISSLPKKADIYLNGKIVDDQQAPARLEKILPADYDITLSKEGYHDWQKRLAVYENSTTFAEDVILWKDSIPLQLDTKNTIDWKISPDRQKISLIDAEQKISVFSIDGEKFIDVKNQPTLTAPAIIGWSNTSKKIIIRDSVSAGNNYYLINVDADNGGQISKIGNKNYLSIKWDADNDNVVYGITAAGLWLVDLFTKEEKLVMTGKIDDFWVKGNQIYTVAGDKILDLSEKSAPAVQAESDGYRLIDKKGDKLIAKNDSRQRIAVWDLRNSGKNFYLDAKDMDWLNDQSLLFFSDWEIWIYNFEDDEPKLITRLGKKIVQAIWHKSGRHVVFATENEIKIIELDNRESRNIIELANLPQIDHLSLDAGGRNLYFAGRYSDQEEFLKLNIR